MVSLKNQQYDLISLTQALFFPTQRWAAQLVAMNDHERSQTKKLSDGHPV